MYTLTRTENKVSTEPNHHLSVDLKKIASKKGEEETHQNPWQTHRIPPPDPITQIRTHKHPWQGNRAQQELPLGRGLDVAVVDNTWDNGSGEHTVRESNL